MAKSVRKLTDEVMDLASAAHEAKTRPKMLKLLEAALSSAPDDTEALYLVAWTLAFDDHDAANLARIRSTCAKLRALTSSVPMKAGEPRTIEASARSFALSYDAPERALAASRVTEAEEILDGARVALAVRDVAWTQAAVQGAKAGVELAKARAAGKPEVFYRWLLDWVAEHPWHSTFPPDHDDEEATFARGLVPFFADPGFVAWLRQQPITSMKLDPEQAARCVVLAAGLDGALYGNDIYRGGNAGRLGRLLALQRIGAPMTAEAMNPLNADNLGNWNVVEIAACYAPELLSHLGELGLSVDVGAAGNPPLVAMVRWGSEQAVRSLIAAGADPTKTSTTKETALDIAKKMKAGTLMALLGGAPGKSSIDVGPVRAAVDKLEKTLGMPWAKYVGEPSFDEVRAFIDNLAATDTSWTDVAGIIDRLDPSERFVLTLAMRDALPQGKPTKLAKVINAEEPRVVLGDLVVSGPLEIGSSWIVTGSVTCERYLDGEASTLYVAGDVRATYIYTEGDFYVGGNVTADVVRAAYPAGSLVVVGTLAADVFVDDPEHQVRIGKREVGKKMKPPADVDAMDMWKQIQKGAFPPKAKKPAAKKPAAKKRR